MICLSLFASGRDFIQLNVLFSAWIRLSPVSSLGCVRVVLNCGSRMTFANLIPKAVKYSAGLLDYYFRGTVNTFVYGTNFTVLNTSGQDFYGGSFYVFQQTNGTRSLLEEFPVTGALPNNEFSNLLCSALMPTNAQFLVIYKGAIGVTGGGTPLDPVDTNLAIAAQWAAPYICSDSINVTNINNLAWTTNSYPTTEGITVTNSFFGTNETFSIAGAGFGTGHDVTILVLQTNICNPTSSEITLQVGGNITWQSNDSIYVFQIWVNEQRLCYVNSEDDFPPKGTASTAVTLTLPPGSETTVDIRYTFISATPIEEYYGSEFDGTLTFSLTQ